MSKPHVVVLGAGPAGMGAAYRLVTDGLARVTVLEAGDRVGGNAGSFELAGLQVDFGSHRLHPACAPAVLSDIRRLLGDDLLDRPRHGRIRLRGRWIHFPLKPADLALRLPPQFAIGVARDVALKPLRARSSKSTLEEDTFAAVLERGLGRTICRDFYFPYARKIWGLEPHELAGDQARRRVSAGSPAKMVRKIASMLPGVKRPGSGRFFYPRLGYGQITEAYGRAAVRAGADLRLGARVRAVETQGATHLVQYEQCGVRHSESADLVWSTIPITALARCVTPALPEAYLRAAESIDYRAMILIYLVLEQAQFSEYDAHYFPEADICISRLSEPKNYRGGGAPHDLTVLCAELPCTPDDDEWRMSDQELGHVVAGSLHRAGIPLRAPIRQVVTRRLRHAYPTYRRGYAAHFQRLDRSLGQIEGLLTFGRQGLFAHDNTHHALAMAYAAADCLGTDGVFNRQRWQDYRHAFERHVVED